MTTQFEVGAAQLFIGSDVATDAGVISTVISETTTQHLRTLIIQSVVDNADGVEDGRIQVQTMSGGTLATRLDIDQNKIGFFGARLLSSPRTLPILPRLQPLERCQLLMER